MIDVKIVVSNYIIDWTQFMNSSLVTMRLRIKYLIPEEEEKDEKENYYYPGCEFEDAEEGKCTCELLNIVDFLWKKFNYEEKSSFSLTSAKKV